MLKNKYLFLVLLLFTSFVANAQSGDYYYWYKGEKQAVQINTEKSYLSVSDNLSVNTISKTPQLDTNKISPFEHISIGVAKNFTQSRKMMLIK